MVDISTRVSGTWKRLDSAHIKVSGTWKAIERAYVKVSGAWKLIMEAVAASTFSGVFSISSAGVGGTVSSLSRTYQLGHNNSGQVQFKNIVHGGTGIVRYNIDGAGNVTVNENDIISLSDLDPVVLSATLLGSGQNAAFDLYDVDTNTIIESVVLART